MDVALVRRLFALVLILGVGLCTAGHAADSDDADVMALHVKANGFLQNLGSDPAAAEKTLARFLEGSPIDQDAKSVQELASKIKGWEAAYGRFLAAERISVRRAGDDLVLMRYLYKGEKLPVVWYFTFYRPRTSPTEARDWTLISVRFDTRYEALGNNN